MSQRAADSLVTEGTELLLNARFEDACVRFEKAAQLFPPHPTAWKCLGQSLLRLGRIHDAASAFDRAIGLAPQSATALWGGAVAHAEIGNAVVARRYLERTLALQPTWIELARAIPQLAAFLRLSVRAAEALRRAFGAFSARTYRHATDEARRVDVGRIANHPQFGQWTFVTIGLSDHPWTEAQRPRIELALATTVDTEACGQILANLAFHLGDTQVFPEPGVIVPDVVRALGAGELSERLPHVLIAVPRAWPLPLPLDDGPPPITLAQVIPVSEAERELWAQHPTDLELALVARGVELADLHRR